MYLVFNLIYLYIVIVLQMRTIKTDLHRCHNKYIIDKFVVNILCLFVLDKSNLNVYKLLTTLFSKVAYIKNQKFSLKLPQRLDNNIKVGFLELTANGGSSI